jgi:uncharacterized membrane protein YdjX (TVP38/TMEM64 family)
MRKLILPILLIAVALAIPVLPFLGFGPALETAMERYLKGTANPSAVAGMVVGLLATDVFLPVPSSVVGTVAGEVLGFWRATAASWIGLMLGALLGFLLARLFGRSLTWRFARSEDLERVDYLSQRWGPAVLVIARPVPLLAEASVLLFGATGLSWRRFLVPVAVANLVIAAGYSALGHWVHLPMALAVSIVIPTLAIVAARQFLSRGTEDPS